MLYASGHTKGQRDDAGCYVALNGPSKSVFRAQQVTSGGSGRVVKCANDTNWNGPASVTASHISYERWDVIASRTVRFGHQVGAMRRRQFFAFLGGAATWSYAARAQQPVIGFVSTRSPSESASVEAAFRKGLGEAGYIEGRNVQILFRWADGQYDRLPSLTADLVDRRVAVIAALGPPAALAAKAATSTIPIVFNVGADPLSMGLVTSMNRPGGNVTGSTFFSGMLATKRLGLLRELLPKIELLAFLVNPAYPDIESQVKEVETAAAALGQRIIILKGRYHCRD